MVLFECHTIQGSVFKSIIEVLKEIINDTNIEVNSKGMKILTMDSSHSCLVSLRLVAENFDTYSCSTSMHLGINMMSLFKLLKSVSSNDTVGMRIEDDTPNELQIVVKNLDKKSHTVYNLKLLDINVESIDIPDVSTDLLVTIPSIDLLRVLRDISNLSETVTIMAEDEVLQISCEGDFANQITRLGSAEHGLSFKYNGGRVNVCADYNVKYLIMFSKSSNVSPIMELHLKRDYPLIMKFPVSLGVMTFALAPKVSGDE